MANIVKNYMDWTRQNATVVAYWLELCSHEPGDGRNGTKDRWESQEFRGLIEVEISENVMYLTGSKGAIMVPLNKVRDFTVEREM